MAEWWSVSGFGDDSFAPVSVNGRSVYRQTFAEIELPRAMYYWAEPETVFWVVNAHPVAFGDAVVDAITR